MMPNVPADIPRKKFTRDECFAIVEKGILDGKQFELLDGEIIFKVDCCRKHITVSTLILTVLAQHFLSLNLMTRADVEIGRYDKHNDPEPDLSVLRHPIAHYVDRGIEPASDVLLAVELSVLTLELDKTVKANLYGKHGVREYWIVDIEKRQLIVHRAPDTENGGYSDIQTYAETNTVSPLEKPDAVIRVADLLP
ncbi:MAG: Uma2 family endonuclease [Armatimonadetes bacterium]|nr:Uma2 family endonuclease [Armatimonadota bacterium]